MVERAVPVRSKRARCGARLWVDLGGRVQLGRGRIELLEAIDRSGSISAAARSVGLSYRAAWNWIDGINQRSRDALVKTATGGSHGGGARLTAAGRAAVQAYRLLERRLVAAMRRVDRDLARLPPASAIDADQRA